MIDVIILAGGLGTRLRSSVPDVPKSMALVAGKPFLEYQFAYLAYSGLYNVILSVGYRKEQIMNYFGAYWRSCSIVYAIEEEPLGTGGAIKNALKFCTSEWVIILNGDTMFTIDMNKLYDTQLNYRVDAIFALRKVPDAGRYGSVSLDFGGWILEFREKDNKSGSGYINGGVYLIKRQLIEKMEVPDKFSFERDFIPGLCRKKKFLGFKSNDYFLDIGIPEDYERAQLEFPELAIKYGLTR